MSTFFSRVGVIVASVLLIGCETVSSIGSSDLQSSRVIAAEDEALFSAVVVKSNQRLMIIDEVDQTVCAEPSINHREMFSSEFADQIGSSVSKGKLDADAALALVASFDLVVDNMITAQGLTFGREQLYSLCIARQNGYIDNADYRKSFDAITEQAAQLIALEIPTMRNAQADEMARLREYLNSALETSNELAEAFSEQLGSEDDEVEDDEVEED